MKFKILIVDDDPLICEGLSRILEERGYLVDSASDGFSTLQMIKKREYDLILLDINLHGVCGIDLLPEIRMLLPGSLVIMITAYNDISLAVKAMKAGAHDYYIKSSDCSDLLTRIQNNLFMYKSPGKTFTD